MTTSFFLYAVFLEVDDPMLKFALPLFRRVQFSNNRDLRNADSSLREEREKKTSGSASGG
jgi:hypothetical protein